MPTYTYRITEIDADKRMIVLNERGAAGWELIEQRRLNGSRLRLLFKKTTPDRGPFFNPMLGMPYKPPYSTKCGITEDPYAEFADSGKAKIPVLPPHVINMIIFCPYCTRQHIDAPDPATCWENPPHKSHLCAYCHAIFRIADIPTNGVREIHTRGEHDCPPAPAEHKPYEEWQMDHLTESDITQMMVMNATEDATFTSITGRTWNVRWVQRWVRENRPNLDDRQPL